MENKTIDIALLKKARQGHEESLSILSELTRRDVLAYLNRLTLDLNLAEDLCQETMLQMLKSLPQLRITTVNCIQQSQPPFQGPGDNTYPETNFFRWRFYETDT